jgi:hypothetical protein
MYLGAEGSDTGFLAAGGVLAFVTDPPADDVGWRLASDAGAFEAGEKA